MTKKVDLDAISVGLDPIEFRWQGKWRKLDILDVFTQLAPHMEALKANPEAILVKFKRVINMEDMPSTKALYLLKQITETIEEVIGNDENFSDWLSSLGFTQGSVTQILKDSKKANVSDSGQQFLGSKQGKFC